MTKKSGRALSVQVVWTLARRTIRDADRDRVLGLSAEVAFFGLFAFPPTMLTILGAVGWLGDLLGSSVADRTARTIVEFSALALSESAVRDVVKPTVERLLQEGRLDVVSIGALVALWSASRAAYALIDALRIAYDVDGKIALWRRNARAIVLTLGGILFSGLALPLLTIGPRFGAGLAGSVGLETTFETLWSALFWPLLVAFAILALTWLYNYAIPWKTPFWRDLPGAVLAMALWLVFGVGLRAYGAWVVDASPVYGSLAAPMVMLLWLYLTTLALLMGGELNAEVEKMWPTISRAERERVRRAAERDVDDDELMLSTQAPDDIGLPLDSDPPSESRPATTPQGTPVPESAEPSRASAVVPKRDVEQTMKSADQGAKSSLERTSKSSVERT